MPDINNIKYYSLEPEEKPKSVLQKRLPLLIGSGIGIVLLIFILIFVVNTVKQNKQVKLQKEYQDRAIEAQLDRALSECDDGDISCENGAQSNVARDMGQPEMCESLEGQELANCIGLIALDKGDVAVCEYSENKEAKISCQDSVNLSVAVSDKNYELCDRISDEDLKGKCKAVTDDFIFDQNLCSEYGIDQSLCDQELELSATVASGNYSACLDIELSEDCDDIFNSIDQDGDGLSAFDEYELGTSDTNSDTDGDGYDDLVEVNGGFDPLT